jgi:PAS domain S-box-containing protein
LLIVGGRPLFWQQDFQIVFSALAGILAFVMIVSLWRQRVSSRLLVPLTIYIAGVALWAIFTGLEASSTSLVEKSLYANLSSLGWVTIPSAFLFFIQFLPIKPFSSRRFFSYWLILEPLITFILVWTNPWHGLIWPLNQTESLTARFNIAQMGPWLWLHLLYSLTLILWSIRDLVQVLDWMQRFNRRKLALFLSGLIFFFLTITLYLTNFSGLMLECSVMLLLALGGMVIMMPLPTFSDTNTDVTLSIDWLRDVSEGMLRLNNLGKIVDTNRFAEKIFARSTDELIDRAVWDVLPITSLGDLLKIKSKEIEIKRGDALSFFDLKITTLLDTNQNPTGWILFLSDITQRREYEMLLRTSEERYRTLFEKANDAVLVGNASGEIVDANQQAADLFGYPRKDLNGKLLKRLHAVRGKDVPKGTPYRCKGTRSDQTTLYLEVSSEPLINGEDELSVEIIRDISDRKLAEDSARRVAQIDEKLRKSDLTSAASLDFEEIFESILDPVHFALPFDAGYLFLVGEDRVVSLVSKQHQTPGHLQDNWEQEADFNLAQAPVLAWIVDHNESLVIKDTRKHPDWRDTVFSGRIRSWVGVPIFMDGRVFAIFALASSQPGMFQAQHVTRLKIFSEQAGRVGENALLFQEVQRRHNNLAVVMEIIRALAPNVDMQTLLRNLYQQIEKIFKVSDLAVIISNEGPNQEFSAFRLVNGVPFTVGNWIEGAELLEYVVEEQRPLVFGDGTGLLTFARSMGIQVSGPIPESWMGVPLISGGEIIGAIGVQDFQKEGVFTPKDVELFSDIGTTVSALMQNVQSLEANQKKVIELSEMTRQAQAGRGAAEAANRAKARFLTRMGQDIRMPLSSILGMTELLFDENLGQDALTMVNVIRTNVEAVSSLVKDILDLSQIETGRFVLENQPFQLRECIEQALDIQVPLALEKGLDLAYFIEPGTPEQLTGDGNRLGQVVNIILNHGLKNTARGGVFLRVWLDEPERRCIHFTVVDTGLGIAPKDIANVFKLPEQSSDRQSASLNMVLGKQICELMGGTAWVESQGVEGLGSTFHFTIACEFDPARKDGGFDQEIDLLSGREAIVACTGPFSRSVLSRYVSSWGMHVSIAVTPEGCLEAFEQSRPGVLVVLDENMGLVQALRRQRKDLPILLLVAMQNQFADENEKDAKLCTDLLPVKPGRLIEALKRLIGGQTAVPAVEQQKPAVPSALSILYADDNPMNRKMMAWMLSKLGYTAELCLNGQEILDKVKESISNGGTAYDVILLDMHMPVLNGAETARRIRSEVPIQYQPYIIGLDFDTDRKSRRNLAAIGLDDMIRKPVNLDELGCALLAYQPVAFSPSEVKKAPVNLEHAHDILNQETIERWKKVMGSGPLLAGVIGIYLTDAGVLIQNLESAMAEKNWAQLHQVAHKLKLSSANFGVTELAACMDEIERTSGMMRANTPASDMLPVLISRVRAIYPKVSQYMRKLQNELLSQGDTDKMSQV